MRFCMVTTFYPPYHFGGDAVFLYHLVCALARHGHRVDVVHCKDAYRIVRGNAVPQGPPLPHPPGVRIHTLHSRWGRLSPLITHQTGHPGLKARRLRRILEDTRFDVVHFHNTSLIGPAAIRYGNAIKLYTMHEHWLVCPLSVLWKMNRRPCDRPQCFACTLHAGRPPQIWRYLGLLRRWMRAVDAFIAPSAFTIAAHRAHGFLPESPIVHIPYFVPAPPQVHSERTPHPRPYFLYVGRLEKMKGVDVLVDVFRNYRKCDLIIIGDGSERNRLRARTRDLPHVHMRGYVPPHDLYAYYRHACAVIVPSVGYETFGIVILEAFTQRTPVIAHRIGALTEIVQCSRGGLLYDSPHELINAMETLRTRPDVRTTLGEQGHTAYRRYWTPEAHLQKYFALIEEIRNRRGSPDR